MTTTPRRRSLVVALLVAAPLVAEFVSGNLPIIYVWLLVIYIPLYGAGALLIREVGRRSARPWPVIVTLGLAYGVAEESFISFSLFNPDYADLRLLEFGWIPALGMGAWWTVFVVVLHAVWSIAVPIVLVEAFAADLGDQPWLSRRGLAGAAAAFALGAVAVTAITLSEDSFVPSAPQLTGAAVALVVLVVVATILARRPVRPFRRSPPADRLDAEHRETGGGRKSTGRAPQPRTLVIASALVGFGFVAGAAQAGPVAVTLIGYALLLTVAAVCIARWSSCDGWDARHRLALATGALVPHVAFALLQPTLVDVPEWIGLAGDLLFATGAVVVVAMAWRATAAVRSESGETRNRFAAAADRAEQA